MERQEENKRYLLASHMLSTFFTVQELNERYPNLYFEKIAPDIYAVEVHPGGQQALEEVNNEIGVILPSVPYGLNAIQPLDTSKILVFHNYPYGELRGKGVIVGFVDTGIEYTNAYFQNVDGTSRILAIWDQTTNGNPPDNFSYGTLYMQADLNAALKTENPLEVVPTTDTNGHGTFLAGIAAGNDQSGEETFTGGAPDADIVMVKMRLAQKSIYREFIIDENVPAYQSDDVIAGITFLVEFAVRQGKPLALCIGLGSNQGAHNGVQVTESYLRNLSQVSNLVIVIAAGNEGNTSHHYEGEVTEGGRTDIELNVAQGESGFQMWFWMNPPNKMTVSIKSPLGEVIDEVPLLSGVEQKYIFSLERTLLSITYLLPDPRTGGERIMLRLQDPTPGLWIITILGKSILDGKFNVWLPGKNFILEDTRFLRPTPLITVQVPGTDRLSLVVGSYDYSDDSVYVASGRGPTADGFIKPDLLAPGVNAAGPALGGGLTTYVGTSTAAAITTAASALLLEWGILNGNLPVVNTKIARSIFILGARRKPGTIYPNPVEGYGRLDVQSSLSGV